MMSSRSSRRMPARGTPPDMEDFEDEQSVVQENACARHSPRHGGIEDEQSVVQENA